MTTWVWGGGESGGVEGDWSTGWKSRTGNEFRWDKNGPHVYPHHIEGQQRLGVVCGYGGEGAGPAIQHGRGDLVCGQWGEGRPQAGGMCKLCEVGLPPLPHPSRVAPITIV